MAEPGPLLGQTLELSIGGPAHGGTCVARYPDPGGRAVFVRHTLPGERVRALVTQDRGGSYCFADAVEILEPAAGRVERPCEYAGPGRCGGCDWQHASPATQRELKLTVVHEQFDRLARLDVRELLTEVVELPGGPLGWRTRNLYAVARDGTLGLHRHGSRDVEPVEHCPLGVDGVGDARRWRRPGRSWPRGAAPRASSWPAGRRRTRTGWPCSNTVRAPGGRRAAAAHRTGCASWPVPTRLQHTVGGQDLSVSAGGFWQVHPHAAETFGAALLELVAPRPGETVFDLYAGAGALTVLLAQAVGETGRVLALESDAAAVADAGENLAAFPHAEVGQGRVSAETVHELADLESPDVVVLDPPRSGAGRDVDAGAAGAAPAGRRLRRLRPGGAGPRRRRRARGRVAPDRPAGLRRVPDDPPRRVRRAARAARRLIDARSRRLVPAGTPAAAVWPGQLGGERPPDDHGAAAPTGANRTVPVRSGT